MKKLIGHILMLSLMLASSLYAQVLPVGSEGSTTQKPALDLLSSDLETQEKNLEAEIEPQLKSARESYVAELQALITKFNQTKRADEADETRRELKRFEDRGFSSEPDKSARGEIRAAWSTFIRAIVIATQSIELKRNTVRTAYLQTLNGIEQTYRTAGDADGVALARKARSTVSLRSLIEGNKLGVTELMGKSGKNTFPWQDVAKEGGYLVGFEMGKGGWYQFSVLGGLKPIFATARGMRDGETRGKGKGTRVVAKEGYAVGGLMVRYGEVVNGVQIIFMKINPDGLSLNRLDFYQTDWIGGEGGGKPKELSAKGKMVVGVIGGSGDVVHSVGLIHLK